MRDTTPLSPYELQDVYSAYERATSRCPYDVRLYAVTVELPAPTAPRGRIRTHNHSASYEIHSPSSDLSQLITRGGFNND